LKYLETFSKICVLLRAGGSARARSFRVCDSDQTQDMGVTFMAALRKLLAAFLLAAFVCIGLPSLPQAGGADDPGYVGGGGSNGESPGSDPDPNTPAGGPAGGDGRLFQLIQDPEEPTEGFCVQFARSWLSDILGVLLR
jgi:hypothetical protein